MKPVAFDRARGDVAQVYRELERDFGVLAPPIALHSPAAGPLAASWLMLRETMLVAGGASRPAKEAVACAVSAGNECPFCERMHTAVLHSLIPGRDAGCAGGGFEEVTEWVRLGAARDTAAANPRPFPPGQLPELLGTVVIMQYLNRMVNVFLGAVPLPPGAPESSLRPVLRVLTWLIRTSARTGPVAGVSLDLLPAAPLPEDLAWAGSNPVIAGAFARAAAAVDEAGSTAVPKRVRDLLHETLDRWDGRPPGLGRGWADDAVAALPAEERAAGRLVLLTALASYTVDESVIAPARAGAGTPDQDADRVLVGMTAWASLTAARRVGAWMQQSG
ncbi:hypothetical protein [Kitasatospora sp. NPDC057015]|uniref:hypothetical protein n=1 Tax=Kitasatospora sp. NPDC057015 TaxID=3346001 RepID=UPI003633333E